MSDLDFDQLVHTAEGRLVLEVLQGKRIPLLITVVDKGEVAFWYPPTINDNLRGDPERMLEWVRILEAHIQQLQATVTKQ